jgi:hypothetical protein
MSSGTRFNRLRILAAAGAMAGMLAAAACDGDNLFQVAPGEGVSAQEGDTVPPTITIVQPQKGAQNAKPLGDSILVEVDVSDPTGLGAVVFGGVAKRGDPSLGTDEVVPRFQVKTVTFPGGVQDTVGLRRYLIPTQDTTRETAFVFVEAFDTLGNRSADTVEVILGGPDVQVLNLASSQTRAAGRLNLSLLVRDPNGVEQVRVDTEGAFQSALVLPITPVRDSVAADTAIVIPGDVQGEVTLTVTARSALGVLGQAGPFLLDIVSGEPVDTVAPEVFQSVSHMDRMELTDSVVVLLSAEDNPEGTGVSAAGVTVRAYSELGGDTLVQTRRVDFDTPQAGVAESRFTFTPFNVDTVALPERIIYQVSSFALDGSGNCAANSSDAEERIAACTQLAGGELVPSNRLGQTLTVNVVSGLTVALPTGGRILDAVVDTVRRNLYLANFGRSRVEVFRMESRVFQEPVPVGAQPWGLSLNTCFTVPTTNCGDTLIVANAGGTNFSFVGLDAFREDPGRRLFTPDVVAFNFKLEESGSGLSEWLITPLNIFSDRPQFLSYDVGGRLHFSTTPTPASSERGTIRKAFNPPGFVIPEVVMHAQAPAGTEEDSWGVLNLDGVSPAPGKSFVFATEDHVVGQLGQAGSEIIEISDTTLSPEFVLFDLEARMEARGSDMDVYANPFSESDLGYSDTTYVTASGNGELVAFGESGDAEISRVLVYDAISDVVLRGIPVADLILNKSDRVSGLGLNYDGTLGVARGNTAYFFSPDLRLQGVAEIVPGGAGAVLHPLHADAPYIGNLGGEYRPDTHLAFVGTGARTIDVYDTFHFNRIGSIATRDVISGPMRASLPFAGDNDGLTCPAVRSVSDKYGNVIGQALEIFQPGSGEPWPVDGGAGGNEDRCVVLKLFGVTDTGGVVVIDVRKSDILRHHPDREND